jgi:predicted cupin superfamily sugar epimerase
MNNKSRADLVKSLTKEQVIKQLNLEHHLEGGFSPNL